MPEPPEIFSHRRPVLMKVYEILRSADEPLPRTRLLQAANLAPQGDNPLFNWLWQQGFLEEIDYREVSGAHMGSARRVPGGTKGYFRISAEGREVRKVYEALFDLMGLSDRVRERFPGIAQKVSVKRSKFSGRYTHMKDRARAGVDKPRGNVNA